MQDRRGIIVHHVTNEIAVGTSSSEVDLLRSLLVSPEMEAVGELQDLLEALRGRLEDPEQLTALILPVITNVLSRKVTESGAAIARAIAPIIDKAIQEKTIQDRDAVARVIGPIVTEALKNEIHVSPEEMAAALAPVAARAIAEHHTTSPQEVAHDLAPIIGGAIKEQIRSERDAIVDALYPVIGSTIARYMSETLNTLVQTINAKIERSLSMQGLMRKSRARLKGVSEAELLLKESMPFKVEAVFLIHKASGLVIAQSQSAGAKLVDSDLLSGMLTAIRGLLNESLAQSGTVSELDQIEYGQSKIVLEVAGYCYLAAVVDGIPGRRFSEAMRKTLSAILEDADVAIQHYRGDPSSIPQTVDEKIKSLLAESSSTPAAKPAKPYPLVIAAGVLILLILVLAGANMYKDMQDRDLQTRVSVALTNAFPGDQIRIGVEGDRVELAGVVANPYIRSQAELLAKAFAPEATIQNSLTLGEQPPFPAITQSRIKEVTAVLDGVDGVSITSEFRDGDLVLRGTVEEMSLLAQVQKSFARIPGIRSLSSTIEVKHPAIENRVYFDVGSAVLKVSERPKLLLLKQWLDRHQRDRLKVIGHNDRTGPDATNRRLAQDRATTIRGILVQMGISQDRIIALRGTDQVPGVQVPRGSWAQRCVRFEVVEEPAGTTK